MIKVRDILKLETFDSTFAVSEDDGKSFHSFKRWDSKIMNSIISKIDVKNGVVILHINKLKQEEVIKMHDITIHLIGGTRTEIKGCKKEVAWDIVSWLDGSENKTFKIDIPKENKTMCFRKENILFIEVI